MHLREIIAGPQVPIIVNLSVNSRFWKYYEEKNINMKKFRKLNKYIKNVSDK